MSSYPVRGSPASRLTATGATSVQTNFLPQDRDTTSVRDYFRKQLARSLSKDVLRQLCFQEAVMAPKHESRLACSCTRCTFTIDRFGKQPYVLCQSMVRHGGSTVRDAAAVTRSRTLLTLPILVA